MEAKGHVEKFLEVFGRSKGELFEGEEEMILAMEQRYNSDVVAFKIKREECALLVVDMQNAFVAPGAPIWIPEALRQVPRIKKLIQACRELNVSVLYAAHTLSEDTKHTYFDYLPSLRTGALAEDSKEADIYEELSPQPGERVISTKHTFSSFIGTDLDYVLRDLGVRTVIICGTSTDVCCESTARDAYCYHYNVVFGSDVTSTNNWMGHVATLRVMRVFFARVMTAGQIIDALKIG